MNTLNFVLTDKAGANATKKVYTLQNGEVKVVISTVPMSNISAVVNFLTQQQQTLGTNSFMLAEADIASSTTIELPTGNASGNDMGLPCFYASRYKGPELEEITLFNLECENVIKNEILKK